MEQGESLASNTSLSLKRSVFLKSFWLQSMYGHLTRLPASLAWWGGVRPGHWTCGYLPDHAVDGGLLVYVLDSCSSLATER